VIEELAHGDEGHSGSFQRADDFTAGVNAGATVEASRDNPPMPAFARHRDGTGRQVAWLWGPGYLALYVLLDWASYIRPLEGLNITPWNPQPALAIALLLTGGRHLPLVWAGLLAAELIVRGVPADWPATLAATAALALAYAATARALAPRLGRESLLSSVRDLLWFMLVCIGGALFSAVVYVSALAAAGQGPSGPLYGAIARYWIGDGVGLIVTLPIFLVLMEPLRRAALLALLKTRQWWVISLLSLLLLYVVFQQDEENHFRFFYLLLLPTVWASARFGLAGAVLAAGLIQLGLIVAIGFVPHSDVTVFELQVLMAAVTTTGLMLGLVVDERTRLSAELRASLRLAAAGQMAAAVAHELGQPLTALGSYARASQLLVAGPRSLGPAELGQLADVSERIVVETQRAGEVIRRLRDLFRSGSTQLKLVAPAAVIRESIAEQRARAEQAGVHIDDEVGDDLPATSMDPVQIGVVLRNLISNAVHAAASGTGGRVVVEARAGDGELHVEVRDNGPGVSAERMASLFDAAPSDKPGGMGLGLSICRAILDAHGGRLWAEPGAGGRFCFCIPSANALARIAHAG
jgi:signal transduction histidine kinase